MPKAPNPDMSAELPGRPAPAVPNPVPGTLGGPPKPHAPEEGPGTDLDSPGTEPDVVPEPTTPGKIAYI